MTAYDPRDPYREDLPRRKRNRRPPTPPTAGQVSLPLWQWVILAAVGFALMVIIGGRALQRWDNPPPPEPTDWWANLDQMGGPAPVYLPMLLPAGSGPFVPPKPDWQGCADLLEAHDALEAAGVVVGPLRAPYIVGFDMAIPADCLPYARYLPVGYWTRGELYLCQSQASLAEVLRVRGPEGRPGWAAVPAGPWLLTIPPAVGDADAARLASALVEACR